MTRSCYLDANVLIYLNEGSAEVRRSLLGLLRQFQAEGASLITSELTIGECLIGARKVGPALIDLHMVTLTDPDLIQLHPVTRPLWEEAARLGAAHGLKLFDAVHVATALAAGCDRFLSNDRRLRDLPGLAVLRPFP